jgi:hypothetical protein
VFNVIIATHLITLIDAPPSSLMDSTVSPKVKIAKGEGVGACSLAHNTLRVEGHVGVPRLD